MANVFDQFDTKQKAGNPFDRFDQTQQPLIANPFADQKAAEPPVEQSNLLEFPKGIVRGGINLQSIPAKLQQRYYALGMEVPDTALNAFDKIDAGELKSKKEINNFLGVKRDITEDITGALGLEKGRKDPGEVLRSIDLAQNYLNASPEDRKKLRDETQAELQEKSKGFDEAVAYSEKIKKKAEPYAPRLKDFTDISRESLGAFIGDASTYFGSKLGEAIPQMVPVIASGVVAKKPGLIGTSIGMELGPATQDRVDYITKQVQNEPDPEKRAAAIAQYVRDTKDVTLTAATVSGLFDAVIGPEADIAKRMLSGELRQQTRKEILKAIPKVAAKSGAQEFLTGGLQETVMINAERMLGEQTGDALTKENIIRVVDSALSEAIGGLGMSTTIEGARALGAKKNIAETNTREGQAIRDLDALADREEQSAGAAETTTKKSRAAKTTKAAPPPPQLRSLDNLTEEEVSVIQRQLYAELGRPANEQELRKAFDDYIVEQNAGNTTESGTDRTSVSGVGFGFEDTGVSDTGTTTTSTSGGLDGTSEATTVSGIPKRNESASLEEQEDAAYDSLLQAQQLQDDVMEEGGVAWTEYQAAEKRFNSLTENTPEEEQVAANQAFEEAKQKLDGIGVRLRESIYKVEEATQIFNDLNALLKEARTNATPTAEEVVNEEEVKSGVDIAALEQEELARHDAVRNIVEQQKALLTKAGRIPAKNSPARKKYEELEQQRIEAHWDWVASEKKLMDAKAAETKTQEDAELANNPEVDAAIQEVEAANNAYFSAKSDEERNTLAQRRREAYAKLGQAKLKAKGVLESVDTEDTSADTQDKDVLPNLARRLSQIDASLADMVPQNQNGINRINQLWRDGVITYFEYTREMNKLTERLAEQRAMRNATRSNLPRERGFGRVVKALEDAARQGRISPQMADMAIWFLTQNRAMAANLAISIAEPTGSRGAIAESADGIYQRTQRLINLFLVRDKNGVYREMDDLTAVHEILHHMERMLPDHLRKLIRNEWRVRLEVTTKEAEQKRDKANADIEKYTKDLNSFDVRKRNEAQDRLRRAQDEVTRQENILNYLHVVAEANATQDGSAYTRALNMIVKGEVPRALYALMNPSEFWAVTGSNIIAGRYGAAYQNRFRRIIQYLRELVQKVKEVFALPSDDPIIRGINAVLRGDGTFVSREMLMDGENIVFPNINPSKGWTTAETEISPEEKRLQEQFNKTGDLHPSVVEAIKNNDLNGALKILSENMTGFYGELATKLLSLNLQTTISFDNTEQVAQQVINKLVGPQISRIMSYLEVAQPKIYAQYFYDYRNPENINKVASGLNTLMFSVLAGKYATVVTGLGPIANEIRDAATVYRQMYNAKYMPGAYFNTLNTITLDSKRIRGLGNRILLHEVIHAATVSLLKADSSQLTPEQLAAREELIKLFQIAKDNIKIKHYGFTNIKEFVAELFTNEEFYKDLKKIPYPAAKNYAAESGMLSKFINAIFKLVGFNNLASRAMTEAEKLFTATRYQETKPSGPDFAQGKKRGKRVRGPITTPSTYRDAESQQGSILQTMKDAYEGRMEWKDAIKIIGPALWDSKNTLMRQVTLPVLNLTHLEDLTRTKFTQLTGALTIIRDMVAYRAKKLNVASQITADWVRLQNKNFAQSQLMGRIMMEATIRGIDPDTAQPGALNAELLKAWNTLKPEYKDIYRRVRNFYSDSVNRMVREMKRRASAIQDPVARAEKIRQIDAQFGPDKLVKPYFPLRRFGQHWFQVGKGEFKEFYEFESPIARDIAMKKRIRELSGGNEKQKALVKTVRKGNGISELYGKNIGTTQVLKDVNELVQNISTTDVTDLKNQLEDSLNQLIYILLPQQSMRKMFINRKAIQGASSDMLRVFATTAVHSAYQQSRFMYAEKFLQNLNNARSEIDGAETAGMLNADQAAMHRDFINEVEKRVPTIMSNEDTSLVAQVAGKASEITFYYMLSAPFTAILNTIGAVQLAMPYIGGSYGYLKANTLLVKNLGKYLGTVPKRVFSPIKNGTIVGVSFPSIVEGANLSPLLRRAADRFIDNGQIDISITNDIMNLGDRPSALYTGIGATVKKTISGLFHQSERMNREIILMTTFELAYDKFLNDYQRQPGMEGLRGVYLRDAQGNKIKNTPAQAFELAIEDATRVAALTLGDFSRQMKGRVFANPAGMVLLKFKQYPILAMYALARNLDYAVRPYDKEELAQYRSMLEEELKNATDKDQIIEQRMEEVQAQQKALGKEARRRLAGILGMTAVLGGQAAMPYFSLVIGTLVKMFAGDDEDDYFDWENWFYNYMETEFGGYLGAMLANAGVKPETAEKVGRTTGEIVSRGVPAAMGMALSDRISLDPKALLWRDGRYSPDARESFIESVIANSGPVVGLGMKGIDAYQLAKEGQYERAAEAALPAIVSKPLSAVRMSKEGARTKGGDVILDDFTATELAMQAIGLQPERLAQKQKAAIAMKQKEQKILDERSAIMNRLWLERDNDDGFDTALERASEFSIKHPGPGTAITIKNIKESFKKRATRAAEAEAFGADIDKRLRGELSGMGGFAEDEN